MHPAAQAYANGKTQAQVKEETGLSYKKIRKILVENQVPVRSRGGDHSRKHFFRSGSFLRTDRDAAYWCGFLMADGCITETPTSSQLIVSLSVVDSCHIEKYVDHLGVGRHAILHRNRTDSDQLSVTVCGKSLPSLLEPWGVVPRKTHTFIKPVVDDDVLPAYLRGWADGDGYVRLRKGKEAFRVTGNPLAVRWYADALRRLGFDGRIGFEDGAKGTWSKLVISGRLNLLRVYRLLQASDTLRLDRKWAPLDSHASEV